MWFATRSGVENSRKTCSPEIIIITIIIITSMLLYNCYSIIALQHGIFQFLHQGHLVKGGPCGGAISQTVSYTAEFPPYSAIHH